MLVTRAISQITFNYYLESNPGGVAKATPTPPRSQPGSGRDCTSGKTVEIRLIGSVAKLHQLLLLPVLRPNTFTGISSGPTTVQQTPH